MDSTSVVVTAEFVTGIEVLGGVTLMVKRMSV